MLINLITGFKSQVVVRKTAVGFCHSGKIHGRNMAIKVKHICKSGSRIAQFVIFKTEARAFISRTIARIFSAVTVSKTADIMKYRNGSESIIPGKYS